MTIISTSTSAFFDRSTIAMNGLRGRAETLQQQLGKGEKLSRSSDDPVAASRLRMLARSGSLAEIDTGNANRANADLTLTGSALGTLADYVTRVKELATSAANGTLTPAQRASIGNEVQQIYKGLVTVANSRDSNGHALFGGESAGDAYALDAAGNASYVGTATAGDLPLGDGQSISRGLTGPEVFDFSANGAPTNLMAVIKTLGDALEGGVADPQSAARDALGALDNGLEAITTSQTIVGSRLSWIELTNERRTNLAELRADEQQEIGATDIATTIAELQQTLTVLEASQASFSKLAQLSLFDVLR
jgi:flagellar hook-associated protein 3 FlgL